MASTLDEIVSDPKRRENLERRFKTKVDQRGDDECWPWTARAVTSFGYGRMTAGRGINLKSHRVAYALSSSVPLGERSVLHSCDNPSCCNPKHLFVGTTSDNVADMWAKGRGSSPPHFYGPDHHNAKISADEALAICKDARAARVVAADYRISEKTVYRLRRGETWKHLQRW